MTGTAENYGMDSDGACQVRLTDDPETMETWHSFSPHGEKIAFTAITGPTDLFGADIYVMAPTARTGPALPTIRHGIVVLPSQPTAPG